MVEQRLRCVSGRENGASVRKHNRLRHGGQPWGESGVGFRVAAEAELGDMAAERRSRSTKSPRLALRVSGGDDRHRLDARCPLIDGRNGSNADDRSGYRRGWNVGLRDVLRNARLQGRLDEHESGAPIERPLQAVFFDCLGKATAFEAVRCKRSG